MTVTQTVLQQVETYCRASGMSERAFGLAVANNHKLVTRLRAGLGMSTQTLDRILAYIEANPRNASGAAQVDHAPEAA